MEPPTAGGLNHKRHREHGVASLAGFRAGKTRDPQPPDLTTVARSG